MYFRQSKKRETSLAYLNHNAAHVNKGQQRTIRVSRHARHQSSSGTTASLAVLQSSGFPLLPNAAATTGNPLGEVHLVSNRFFSASGKELGDVLARQRRNRRDHA